MMKKYYLEDLERLLRFLAPVNTVRLTVRNGRLVFPKKRKKFANIIINNILGEVTDIQTELLGLQQKCEPKSRIIITYYNHLWEPLLKAASFLGWRKRVGEQNWLGSDDIANLLNLAGFEVIAHQKRMLLPIDIPLISVMVNKWLAPLPLINELCLTTCAVARPKSTNRGEYSVSIVIPARNEAGNIPRITKSIPVFGKSQEIIFVEGHSKDGTWKTIESIVKEQRSMNKKNKVKIKAYKQKGVGKADAVRLGFEKATGEVLIILDADLTVSPIDLPKFYDVLASGLGEFANGCRLVYPMEKEAMRTLNILGNEIFSRLFTWILGQRFKDTLCGTKAIFAEDYKKIVKNRGFFGEFDPFGDFDLIFGAVKQNLKVVEVPIRYKERVYGSTNINRYRHGLLLFKMTWFAFMKFRVW